MIAQQVILIVFGVVVNILIAASLPTLLYFVLTKPVFASWLRAGIEDGDGIPHKQDLKDLVILFFAGIFAWLLFNILFIWLFFDRQLLTLSTSVFSIVGILFGISKINIQK